MAALWIDCHCHWDPGWCLQSDGATAVSEAYFFGGTATATSYRQLQVVMVGETDADLLERLLPFQDRMNKEWSESGAPLPVCLCAGLHPVSPRTGRTARRSADTVLQFRHWVQERDARWVGIGECGLDFHPKTLQGEPDWSPDEQRRHQLWELDQHIELAKSLQLPLNLHSRQAGHHVIERLVETGFPAHLGALLHAFDGNKRYVRRAIEAGCYFSAPPSLTRLSQPPPWVHGVPADRWVLESDAPALGPVAGQPNDPWSITVSAEWLSALLKVDRDQVVELTTRNAQRLFPRLAMASAPP